MTILVPTPLKQLSFHFLSPLDCEQDFETSEFELIVSNFLPLQMCEDGLVRKKTAFASNPTPSPSLPSESESLSSPSVVVSFKKQNPFPKPIGNSIQVVPHVSVVNNQDLLENQDTVLECLEPLLKEIRRAVPSGDHAIEGRETKRRRLEPSENELPLHLTLPLATAGRSAGEEGETVDLTDHQAALWNMRFQELIDFRKRFGHCLVPHKWMENTALATWVKRQRYQYKLREQGRRSTLTKERKDGLDKLGFVWDSHNAIWEERYQELIEFKEEYGHVSVPSTYKNHSLSVWVQCQRRQWKLMKESTESRDSLAYQIKQSRVERLEALGFVWEPRKKQQNEEQYQNRTATHAS